MATMQDSKPSELVSHAAEELKNAKAVKMPEWAMVVKTGPAQEHAPAEKDWWYKRAASILRKVSLRGPIGVAKLRSFYGKKKNRGVKPEHFFKGSGKIVRVILQQLEAEGLVKKVEKGVHKGKIITPKGQSFLDKAVKKHGSGGTKKAEA